MSSNFVGRRMSFEKLRIFFSSYHAKHVQGYMPEERKKIQLFETLHSGEMVTSKYKV